MAWTGVFGTPIGLLVEMLNGSSTWVDACGSESVAAERIHVYSNDDVDGYRLKKPFAVITFPDAVAVRQSEGCAFSNGSLHLRIADKSRNDDITADAELFVSFYSAIIADFFATDEGLFLGDVSHIEQPIRIPPRDQTDIYNGWSVTLGIEVAPLGVN